MDKFCQNNCKDMYSENCRLPFVGEHLLATARLAGTLAWKAFIGIGALVSGRHPASINYGPPIELQYPQARQEKVALCIAFHKIIQDMDEGSSSASG